MSDLSNAIVCAFIASVASGVAVGSRIGGRAIEVFDPVAEAPVSFPDLFIL